MKNQTFTPEKTIDDYGRALARRLNRDGLNLGYDIGERLRAARMQAMAARKPELVAVSVSGLNLSAGQASLTSPGAENPIWNRLASFLPLVALVLGLMAIQNIQSDFSVSEIAEVDSALLLDELPPGAYTDPGFLQFLKTNQTTQTEAH